MPLPKNHAAAYSDNVNAAMLANEITGAKLAIAEHVRRPCDRYTTHEQKIAQMRYQAEIYRGRGRTDLADLWSDGANQIR